MKSTSEILTHHQKSFAARDLDELMSDYADDAVFFSADGAHRGLTAIRAIFEKLFHEFGKPGASITPKQRLVEGE